MFKHLIEDLEIEYSHHPRIFWIIFLAVALLFIIVQSYFALPRDFSILLTDSFFPILFFLMIAFVFFRPNNRNLLIIGVINIMLTIFTLFSDIIPKPYGTFFFLFGIWLIIDWYNYRRYKISIFSELINGNYYLALGVFLSSFVFAFIVEIINLPFLIWEYNIPLPSLNVFGVPALIAAFGWVPWVLSIFAIFYPFALRKPKKHK